nr:CCA tRNA nucleotidyltransferase [Gemmatimonadales bacterium]
MTTPLPGTVPVPPQVLEIVRTLTAAGHEAWCVGGALRDALLGQPEADFDVATSATPDQVRRLFARTIAVGEQYGTIGVLDRDRVLHEVTTFRRDVSTDGRHAVVAFGVSLEDDLARRDFTINALAFQPLTGEWRDPFGGAADLALGRVRAVGRADERFREDYLRILRAVRFAARYALTIEPDTWHAALAAAPGLAHLSAERVRDEWFKGLRSARSVLALAELWRDVGAADIWLPELRLGTMHRRAPLAGAADESLSALPRDPVLLTVALMPNAPAVLRRLKASNAEIARAAALVSASLPPLSGEPAAVRHWLARAGSAADDSLALHLLTTGMRAPWASAVDEIRSRGDA